MGSEPSLGNNKKNTTIALKLPQGRFVSGTPGKVASGTVAPGINQVAQTPGPQGVAGTVARPVIQLADSAQNGEDKLLKIRCHLCSQKLEVTALTPFIEFLCPACGAKLIVPMWFGAYLLEEKVGEGGMAEVYRALDLALEREVAIKILKQDIAGQRDFCAMFLHEARMVANLNHTGTLQVFSCGDMESRPYMVMQYMAKGSLENVLKTGIPASDKVLRWMINAAEGLENARRFDIIHHDVKPANILLDDEGNARVGDFGIAQALFDFRSQSIMEFAGKWGTPQYASPEKIATGKEDFKGDIYSFGVTLYQLLTGMLPYENKYQAGVAPRPPKELRSDLSGELSDFILRLISPDASKRPDYREIIEVLNGEYEKLTGKVVVKKKGGPPPAKVLFKTKKKFVPWKIGVLVLAASILLTVLIYYCAVQLLIDNKKTDITNDNSQSGTSLAAQAFLVGNSVKAQNLALTVFQDVKAGLPARINAGLQLALAYYLNKSDDATGKCTYIVETLKAAGAKTNTPVMAIITYLAEIQSNPQTVKEKLSSAGDDYVKLGNFAALLKELYQNDVSSLAKDLFAQFEKDAENCPQKSAISSFARRIYVYKDAIGGKGFKNSMEPLFASFIK